MRTILLTTLVILNVHLAKGYSADSSYLFLRDSSSGFIGSYCGFGGYNEALLHFEYLVHSKRLDLVDSLLNSSNAGIQYYAAEIILLSDSVACHAKANEVKNRLRSKNAVLCIGGILLNGISFEAYYSEHRFRHLRREVHRELKRMFEP